MNKLITKIIKPISLLTIGVTLTACGNNSSSSNDDQGNEEVPTITIWGNGGQEVRDAVQNVAEQFNKDEEYSQYAEVEVQWVVSGTSDQSLDDRLAAAEQAGQTDTDFDLLAIDDSGVASIEAQTSEDFFVPIDTSKISNYDNLIYSDNIIGDKFIPYRATSVYLGYNEEMVPNPPETDTELYEWIADNPGQFAYNDPTTGNSGFSLVANTIYNNLPEEVALSGDSAVIDEYSEEFDAGFELLKELHPHLYQTGGTVQYTHKNQGSLDLLNNQQIAITPVYANMVLSQRAMGVTPEEIKMTQLEQPFMGGLAGFLRPHYGGEGEAEETGAYKVIDYFLSPEGQTTLWNTMYATPVIAQDDLIDPEHPEWLSEIEVEELRYFSIGEIRQYIGERWKEEIQPLAK